MLKKLFGRTPKTYQVHVEPFGTTITVGSKETLLQAALRTGLAYPYECQTGACSTCKTQLVSGNIKALSDFAYVLELEEIQNGTILACQSLARSDLAVRVETLDDGLPPIRPQRSTGHISAVAQLTSDIIEVCVNVDVAMDYYAGQYAKLAVPGIAESRSYSFASAPNTGGTRDLSFHIRLLPNGEVSAWFADSDRVGTELEIEGPFGVFRLHESAAPILCIAGGSGMAPIKALLEHGAVSDTQRPVVYLYGARTQADLYDKQLSENLIAAWPTTMRFVPVLSEEPENSDWAGARGLVTDFIATVDDFGLPGCQAYLCGPPGMIDAALTVLNHAGVRGRDIYFDKFMDRSHSP